MSNQRRPKKLYETFGEIDKSASTIESKLISYSQNLNHNTNGISSIDITSGSSNTNYWNSLNNLYYTSGSTVYPNEQNKFSLKINNFTVQSSQGSQFVNKFHNYDSISLISIPSVYYGEKIKPGTFIYTDKSGSTIDNNGLNPVIKDDGFGNLYSTNADTNFGTLTTYPNSSISSSDNYVGNIFYDKGLVVITETGSWSGSVNYSDLANEYSLTFDSLDTVVAHEYIVNVKPNEFNHTMNWTIRNPLSGSDGTVKLSTSSPATYFTSSDFQPYITTINLYQDGDYDTPVITAKLPRAIRKSNKLNLRFKIKLDL